MSRWTSILRAAAPLTVLLLLAAGARLLPSGSGDEAADDAPETALRSLSSGQKTPSSKHRGAAKPAPPRPVDGRTQAILQKVVSGQLSAFAKGDFSKALRFSAPEFRQTYSPDAFRQMVQFGYAGLLQYESLRFKPAQGTADMAMMPVLVKARDGSENSFLYILRRGTGVGAATRKRTEKSDGKAEGTSGASDVWYIEGVSQGGMRGGPGTGAPGSERITDLREL